MTTAEAKQKSMAKGPRKKEVARARRTAKTALNVTRDLVRSLTTLEESLSFDFFGRVVWRPDEPVEHVAAEVRDLLRLARDDYRSQEIEVNVTVRIAERETE